MTECKTCGALGGMHKRTCTNRVMGDWGSGGVLADPLWNDACPCGHGWKDHNITLGCFNGWEYTGADPGVASKEGCACQLAHTEKSNDDLR